MLDVTSVSAQLDAGATFADIAVQHDCPLTEVKEFARKHSLREPSFLQLQHMRNAIRTGRNPAVQWERLITDDRDGRVVNGIDTATSSGNVTALDILRHYHGDVRCWYTGEPTDLVFAADASPPNLLISNLVPVTQRVLDERFADTVTVVEGWDRTFNATVGLVGPPTPLRLGVTIEHKFDKVLGAGMNADLIDEAVEQWIEPYLRQHRLEDILSDYGLPATPFLTALWVWRRLERHALLKGLARVKIDIGARSAYVTKNMVLGQVRVMLQRRIGDRRVATAHHAVMPQPGQSAPPARLIKL